MRKITLMITALFCAMFVVQIQAAKVEPSTTMPDKGKPEHVYTMTSGNGVTSSALTAPTQTEANYGQFAFYPAGMENVYYIYSRTANKWLSYTKAASYGDGKDFIQMTDAQVDGAYFLVDNYSGDFYQISPYTTSGTTSKYLNWYQGVNGNPYDSNHTLGLYGTNGAGDGGSRYTFTEVVIVERTYTISIPDGQTIKIGDVTYNNGDKYTIEGAI